MNSLKIEQHPFDAFYTALMKCLIIGSFPRKEQTRSQAGNEQWYYGAPLNQFWRILEITYNRQLKSKEAIENLFKNAGIGIRDIFKTVIRKKQSNSDRRMI